MIETLDDANFETRVLHSDRPVLVDFWATWCQPCLRMVPVLEELAQEYDGRMAIAKLNVERNSVIPARYQVRSLPTLIIFQGGHEVNRAVGFLSKRELHKRLNCALDAQAAYIDITTKGNRMMILPIEPSAEAEWLMGKTVYGRKDDVKRLGEDSGGRSEEDRQEREGN